MLSMTLDDVVSYYSYETLPKNSGSLLSQGAGTTFVKSIDELIPELKSISNQLVYGYAFQEGDTNYHMVVSDHQAPKLMWASNEQDGYKVTSVVTISNVEEVVDDLFKTEVKIYFLGLVNLCLSSSLIKQKLKEILIYFTNQALECDELPFPNFWELNSQVLLKLIKQHQVSDFGIAVEVKA